MTARLAEYLASGGLVMPPLVCLGLALWYLLVLRAYHLRRGIRGKLGVHLDKAARGWIPPDDARGVIATGLRLLGGASAKTVDREEARILLLSSSYYLVRYRKVVRAIVLVAPLLGLLGTVSGMIETFASLGDMALFSRSGGIAGGIAEALVSTQLGLLVAIPGMFATRLLDARQQRLRRELKRLREALSLLATDPGTEGVAP